MPLLFFLQPARPACSGLVVFVYASSDYQTRIGKRVAGLEEHVAGRIRCHPFWKLKRSAGNCRGNCNRPPFFLWPPQFWVFGLARSNRQKQHRNLSLTSERGVRTVTRGSAVFLKTRPSALYRPAPVLGRKRPGGLRCRRETSGFLGGHPTPRGPFTSGLRAGVFLFACPC